MSSGRCRHGNVVVHKSSEQSFVLQYLSVCRISLVYPTILTMQFMLYHTNRDKFSVLRVLQRHRFHVESDSAMMAGSWATARSLSERIIKPAVFRVNQSVSLSIDDVAMEAMRQLPADPLLTAGCTSCKRSTSP